MQAARKWRKFAALTGLALLSIVTSPGCASTATGGSHIVTLEDGRVYRSPQKPLLDSKTGYYKFRDRYGRDVLLREREVASVVADKPQPSRG